LANQEKQRAIKLCLGRLRPSIPQRIGFRPSVAQSLLLRHSRRGGSPEVLGKTGFPPEFTPAKAEAGMTEKNWFGLFTSPSTLFSARKKDIFSSTGFI